MQFNTYFGAQPFFSWTQIDGLKVYEQVLSHHFKQHDALGNVCLLSNLEENVCALLDQNFLTD